MAEEEIEQGDKYSEKGNNPQRIGYSNSYIFEDSSQDHENTKYDENSNYDGMTASENVVRETNQIIQDPHMPPEQMSENRSLSKRGLALPITGRPDVSCHVQSKPHAGGGHKHGMVSRDAAHETFGLLFTLWGR